FQMRRGGASVIGRQTELAAIEAELAAARNGLSSVTLEGEPGVGKTRLLVAATQFADRDRVTLVAGAAGGGRARPVLLVRAVPAPALGAEAGAGAPVGPGLSRALRALSGHRGPRLESLPRDQKLLRQFDLVTMAMRGLAAERPVALMADDIQWADEDSLRALR